MEKIKWTSRFSVNVEELDKQHKQIIQCTNDLLEAVEHGSKAEEIEKLFYTLKDYSEHHFSYEEEYIKKMLPIFLKNSSLNINILYLQ